MNGNHRYIQWKTNNPDSYEEVLRRRRERYQQDEEYRKSQLQHAAEWREKKRRERKKAKKRKRTPKPRLFLFEDRQIECWSAGRTAEFLGVDKKTITNLEKSGTIPLNHGVAANKHRWWPANYVRWLKTFFEEKAEIPAQEFSRRVWIGWSEEQVRGVIPMVSGGLLREVASDDGETQEQGVAS